MKNNKKSTSAGNVAIDTDVDHTLNIGSEPLALIIEGHYSEYIVVSRARDWNGRDYSSSDVAARSRTRWPNVMGSGVVSSYSAWSESAAWPYAVISYICELPTV